MLTPKEQGSPRNSQAQVPQNIGLSGKNVDSFTEGERLKVEALRYRDRGGRYYKSEVLICHLLNNSPNATLG